MILYLDSSAIVKLYVAEPESEHVRESVEQASACITHLVAYAEVRAGLARALRHGRETPERFVLHKQEFEETWREFDVVLPDDALVHLAGDLSERFGLRGYDSVHLAAASFAWDRTARHADFLFVGFDGDLVKAAKSLGMSILGS